MTISETWHGTIGGYTNHKCRCEACSDASSEHAKKYRAANREKRNAYQAKWRAENPEKARDLEARSRARNRERARERNAEYNASGERRSWRYGLQLGQLTEMRERQGGRCAICRDVFEDGRFHIDHDHACCPRNRSCGKCVRGLLCKACNDGLGRFCDDADRLRNAADYIERHQGT